MKAEGSSSERECSPCHVEVVLNSSAAIVSLYRMDVLHP